MISTKRASVVETGNRWQWCATRRPALVAAWLWRGEWFEAYDAALWLIAFATLEMDVLGFTRKQDLAA